MLTITMFCVEGDPIREHHMPTESSTKGRFSRLSEAVRKARADSVPSTPRPEHRGERGTGRDKAVQRAIKYPNSSTALRRLVAETQPVLLSGPSVRLRATARLGVPDESERTAHRTGLVQSLTRDPNRAPPVPGPKSLEPEQSRRMITIRTASDIGEIVRRARRNRDLTQSRLAAMARTGRRFISELEAGKPTLEFERLLNVCHVLGINLFVTTADR